MSVEINWTALTSGAEAHYLSETIRLFIHDRFQQIQLPRFIRSVQVHSFAFGDVAPEIVVKDICDPLPEFYQQQSDDEGSLVSDESVGDGKSIDAVAREEEARGEQQNAHVLKDGAQRSPGKEAHQHPDDTATARSRGERSSAHHDVDTSTANKSSGSKPATKISVAAATTAGSNRPRPLTMENKSHSFFNSNQSAIPGGTSNMTHFHLPYSAPFSGPTTPLAAMAGGHFAAWPDLNHPHHQQRQQHQHAATQRQTSHNRQSASISSVTPPSSADPGSRPPSQHRQDSIDELDSLPGVDFAAGPPSPPEQDIKDRDPNDIQIVAHVKYSGNMKLSITAELSLDYPMSSFVGIPLQLQITGFSFDGVAIIAHVDRKVYTCFLSPEDAQAFLGPDQSIEKQDQADTSVSSGALLQEIRVESEIGQTDGGKQVLKNVGKVEKFVLEQVRRIFEDEFVYPSFWTFLL